MNVASGVSDSDKRTSLLDFGIIYNDKIFIKKASIFVSLSFVIDTKKFFPLIQLIHWDMDDKTFYASNVLECCKLVCWLPLAIFTIV
jgi:hypothetical protein